MYVHSWATQNMNQELKNKKAQNSKNLRLMIQVLTSKLGITLRVSVTSATIIMARRTIHINTLIWS